MSAIGAKRTFTERPIARIRHGALEYTSLSHATMAGSYLLGPNQMSQMSLSQPFEPAENEQFFECECAIGTLLLRCV